MSTRMTSADFVGRSEQLAELRAALRDAARDDRDNPAVVFDFCSGHSTAS